MIILLLCFSSSLLICDLAVGKVGFRSGFSMSASHNNFSIFSSAAVLFRNWVRAAWDLTTSSPTEFILRFNFRQIISFSWSDRPADERTLKRSSTRVLTLLTFWPPGPLLREAVKINSSSGIRSFNSCAVNVLLPINIGVFHSTPLHITLSIQIYIPLILLLKLLFSPPLFLQRW